MKNIASIFSLLCTSLCASGYENVPVERFASIIAEPNVQLVDVRTSSEYAEGHITGAILIDFKSPSFKDEALNVLTKEKPVAIYCRSGRRSASAADILTQEGFDVYNLDTGIIGWNEAGLPTTRTDMKKTDIYETLGKENVIELIGKQWMLVTAGTKDHFNTMTASWGGIGYLWNKPVAFIFIRPERYTHDFIEESGYVTLSFFSDNHRQALKVCGSRSGRDCDKISEAGLSPIELENGQITFSQARMTVVGRKIFKAPMNGNEFIDKSIINGWYGEDAGFHDVYILEIESVYE